MRVLVCGDRNWNDPWIIDTVLSGLDADDITVVHGNAPGADTMGGEAGAELGYKVEVFPAEWDKYRRAAGPKRNQQMLDSGLDIAFAFHDDLTKSKGTADMVRRLQRVGVLTYVIGRA